MVKRHGVEIIPDDELELLEEVELTEPEEDELMEPDDDELIEPEEDDELLLEVLGSGIDVPLTQTIL